MSPLPFGVLPVAPITYYKDPLGDRRSPLPFGVLPVAPHIYANPD